MLVTITQVNTLFICLIISISRIRMLMPQLSEEEQALLMKETGCFKYKKKAYTVDYCSNKGKNAALWEGVGENNNSQVKD